MIGVCILNLSFKITGIYQQLPYLFQQLTSPCVYTFDVSLIKSLILGMMKISSDIFCIILVFNIIPMIFRLSVFLCAGRDSLDIFLVFLNSGNRINDKKIVAYCSTGSIAGVSKLFTWPLMTTSSWLRRYQIWWN